MVGATEHECGVQLHGVCGRSIEGSVTWPWHIIDALQIPKAINGMLEETVGRGFMPPFKEMQVVQYLLPIKFQWATAKMQDHMGKTARIIGMGTLALAG